LRINSFVLQVTLEIANYSRNHYDKYMGCIWGGGQGMAIIRPEVLDEDIYSDPFRKAEITVFEACKRLPNKWYVLYGVFWKDDSLRSSKTEGEADFVIVGPEIGIIIMEVKGGGITRIGDSWYSIDRKSNTHPIKNPIKQADISRYHIRDYIKRDIIFANKYLMDVSMVCFPNISKEYLKGYIDCPLVNQIGFEDLSNLYERLTQMNPDKKQYLSDKECLTIANILKPDNLMPGTLSVLARRQTEIMDRLTAEQEYILKVAERNKMVAITGPAGSGKTLVAMKWALMQSRKGKKVLVLVPPRNLRLYYKSILGNESNIKIDDFSDADSHFYENYDLIVIDESQLFPMDLWKKIGQHILDSNDSRLLFIYDANQNLLQHDLFDNGWPITELNLKKIIRNTKEIAETSSRFMTDKYDLEIVGPSGPEVYILETEDSSTESDEMRLIDDFILQLVIKEDFDYSDIVVLFADSGGSRFKETENRNGLSYRTTKTFSGQSNKHPIIKCGSVSSYIGMESSVVVLVGLDKIDKKMITEACYIGTSRARNVLAITANKKTIDKYLGNIQHKHLTK
jgi:DNA replication protein DnaC